MQVWCWQKLRVIRSIVRTPNQNYSGDREKTPHRILIFHEQEQMWWKRTKFDLPNEMVERSESRTIPKILGPLATSWYSTTQCHICSHNSMKIFVLAEENNTHHETISPPDCQRKCRCGIFDKSVQGKVEEVDVLMECDERKSPNGLDYRQSTEEEHDCNINE